MEFSTDYKTHADPIVNLFTATFTASEGEEEGQLIGGLARRLLTETPAGDIYVYTAWEDGSLLGSICFTRLTYTDEPRTIFLLGPVAVATERQRQGIGQRLITHGITSLREKGVDIVVTYGDPNFYSRVGFTSVTQDEVPSPYSLQHPEGWLAQSLTGDTITPLKGPVYCVEAFKDPIFW